MNLYISGVQYDTLSSVTSSGLETYPLHSGLS